MFNFLKKEKEEKIIISTTIPNEIASIKVPEYNKKDALKTFLEINGYNSVDITNIMNAKFPFDKAWRKYFFPMKTYYDEMLRQMCHLKLLVIEGLTNNEQRGSFILCSVEYFRLFVSNEIGVSYPKCERLDYYDLKGFCKQLNEENFEQIKKRIDKDVFNCIAFYSQKFNISYKEILIEMIDQIEMNLNMTYHQFESIGGPELFIDMVSKLLELSCKKMRFSLNSVIPIKEVSETSNQNEDFFDFSNIKSINEGIQKEYIIQDKNEKIAEKEILKALNILAILKKYKKIPEDVTFDVKNIIYGKQYNTFGESNSVLITFLRYTPLTSTGKIAKNMCTFIFDINRTASKHMIDGIYVVNNFEDDEEYDTLHGIIKYNKDKEITEISMSFFDRDKSYNIKTKTDIIEKISDVELNIEKIY